MTNGQVTMGERSGDHQRLRDALSRKFTGEVPFFECYVAESIVNRVMGRPMGTHMLNLPAADYVEFLTRVGMDAAYLYVPLELGRKYAADASGVRHYVDGTVKTRRDIKRINLPSAGPVKKRIETFLEAAQATSLGVVYAVNTSAAEMITAIGPEDSLLLMHDDPDFILEFCNRVDDYTVATLECIAQYPIDNLWVSGLRCSNTGPMISPEMHEKFIRPRLERVLDITRPSGVPVTLHADGDISSFMDWIVTAGFAAIHPVEPGIGHLDIYDLKKRYGHRICLCGNIDVGSVLSAGTPRDVSADVLEHICLLAPGGGYVCGSSHDITENIPFENFCALTQTVCAARVRED